MNINNEQRKAFADIVEQNGRSQEFYEKFGKARIVKNEKAAQVILNQVVANDKLLSDIKDKHSKAEKELENKNGKIQETISDTGRILATKLEKLGYSTSREYRNNKYGTYLQEDTSITRAEYEMFKKRALTNIWGAESLEVAKKAIDNYLDLLVK